MTALEMVLVAIKEEQQLRRPYDFSRATSQRHFAEICLTS
jgi:hypothetical protein